MQVERRPRGLNFRSVSPDIGRVPKLFWCPGIRGAGKRSRLALPHGELGKCDFDSANGCLSTYGA